MDLGRLRVADWIAGAAGLALIVSLFLPWYSDDGGDATAWEAFSVADVVLLLGGLIALAVLLAGALQRTAALHTAVVSLATPIAIVAALVALYRGLNAPGDGLERELGYFVGMLAALVAAVGCWRSMMDERVVGSGPPTPEPELIPAPTPTGERRGAAST